MVRFRQDTDEVTSCHPQGLADLSAGFVDDSQRKPRVEPGFKNEVILIREGVSLEVEKEGDIGNQC